MGHVERPATDLTNGAEVSDGHFGGLRRPVTRVGDAVIDDVFKLFPTCDTAKVLNLLDQRPVTAHVFHHWHFIGK
jgi:hypothetical protein